MPSDPPDIHNLTPQAFVVVAAASPWLRFTFQSTGNPRRVTREGISPRKKVSGVCGDVGNPPDPSWIMDTDIPAISVLFDEARNTSV